jgi:hypothetical protein
VSVRLSGFDRCEPAAIGLRAVSPGGGAEASLEARPGYEAEEFRLFDGAGKESAGVAGQVGGVDWHGVDDPLEDSRPWRRRTGRFCG